MSSFEAIRPGGEEAAQQTRQQSEFEIEFFRRVLARHPQHLEVLRQQARLLAGRGLREEGLACNRQLADELPHDPNVRYHLACSLAALGLFDQAVEALLQAVELGYRDFDHLESDPDLDALRDHPRFQAILRGHGLQS